MYFKQFLISCLFSFVVIPSWNNTALAWWGSGEKTISPDTVLLVSTLEKDQSVTIYLGGDQENYIDVVIKSSHIKDGAVVRSEDGSISSDGLSASAQWKKVGYFSSSNHPTFVTFKIQALDMENQKAVIQVSAKLVDPSNEKYLQFNETSFELTGNFFKEFTKFMKREVIELTAEQIAQVEQAFGNALYTQKEHAVDAFNKCLSNNFKGFAQYKVKAWLPNLENNKKVLQANIEKYGLSRLKPEFEQIQMIDRAMVDLNIVSIKMQSYLKNNRQEDLQFIKKKISEISSLSDQYKDYHPPQN